MILLGIAAALMYLDISGAPQLQAIRQWTATVIQPVAWVASLPHTLATLGDNLQSRTRLVQENAELKREQLILRSRLQRTTALETENQRLRSLLSSSTVINQRVLIVEILEASQKPYRNQLLVNKGTADGVYTGQALVDAWGVLGQVIRVHRHTAVALLITDPQSGIPVEINRTGLHTVALGRGDGSTLSLPYLPNNTDIHVGDLLVSSGLGGRFPAGYPVGEVVQLRHPSGGSFMEAIAQPAAHIGRGHEALLVWNRGKPGHTLPKLPIQVPAPGTTPPTAAHASPQRYPTHPESSTRAAKSPPASSHKQ